jgi:hypothetical protein
MMLYLTWDERRKKSEKNPVWEGENANGSQKKKKDKLEYCTRTIERFVGDVH